MILALSGVDIGQMLNNRRSQSQWRTVTGVALASSEPRVTANQPVAYVENDSNYELDQVLANGSDDRSASSTNMGTVRHVDFAPWPSVELEDHTTHLPRDFSRIVDRSPRPMTDDFRLAPGRHLSLSTTSEVAGIGVDLHLAETSEEIVGDSKSDDFDAPNLAKSSRDWATFYARFAGLLNIVVISSGVFAFVCLQKGIDPDEAARQNFR
jgi:hypothetical protein